jgi:hypothetical protein
MSAADVKAAVDKALADERTRMSGIQTVCQKAGKPEMATEFIANGTSLADVQNRMFEILCAARPPVGDGGSNNDPAQPKDPNDRFKAEYAADRKALQKAGISEEDYVASRRVTEGLDDEAGVVRRSTAAASK